MSIKRKDTAEAREFWEHVEKMSEKVQEWPEWKKRAMTGFLGWHPEMEIKEDPKTVSRFERIMKNVPQT